MKHAYVVLLIVTVSTASYAKMQQKETAKERGTPSIYP